MAQEFIRQVSFAGGEVDPKITRRRDWKGYFSSLAGARNLMPLPQGPIVRRPGLAFVDYIRHPLLAVDISAATVAAPNGGTPGAAIDGDAATAVETTADLGAGEYVVLTLDLGAPKAVAAFDLVDYAAVDGAGTPPVIPPIVYPWPYPFPLAGFLP